VAQRLRGGRSRSAAARTQVVQALSALAAELASGRIPSEALVDAGGDPSPWPAAVAAARHGGDIADGLSRDARSRAGLRHLAACWRIAETTGAGLAPAVARLAAAARSDERARVELDAQLAGPRASARLLATLPIVGLALGTLLGADALAWLVTTPIGVVCVAGGVTLTALGLWWTRRIAASVERLL
jgi:tight adherence protein B